MVQAADFGKPHDLARRGRLDRPDVGGVLVEREVGTRLMVVSEISGQDATEVVLAEDEHVIQALAPDRADEPLHERVLPRALRRREDFGDPHALHSAAKMLAKHLVVVGEEIGRCGVVWEGVDDLLGGPGSSRVPGDVEVDHPPAVVGEDDKDEEDAEASSRAR